MLKVMKISGKCDNEDNEYEKILHNDDNEDESLPVVSCRQVLFLGNKATWGVRGT